MKEPKLICLGLIKPQSESATISLLEAFYNKARLNNMRFTGAFNPFCFPWWSHMTVNFGRWLWRKGHALSHWNRSELQFDVSSGGIDYYFNEVINMTCLGLNEPQSESATISLLEAFYDKARLNNRRYAGAFTPFCFPWWSHMIVNFGRWLLEERIRLVLLEPFGVAVWCVIGWHWLLL